MVTPSPSIATRAIEGITIRSMRRGVQFLRFDLDHADTRGGSSEADRGQIAREK